MATVAIDAWRGVVGQDHLVDVLRQAVALDTLAHGFVLVGDAGLGQVALTRGLAAALNCPQATDGAGCGACDVCDRIVRGVHPAVIEIEPDGAQHAVSDVRDVWLPAATVTMSEGRRRVIRIVDADLMNVPAQNALLKLLEEPPVSVVWVLDVRRDTALLDTVLSRCHVLHMRLLDAGTLASLATSYGIREEHVARDVRLSGGSPARLRDLADPDLAVLRDTAVNLLHVLHEAGPVAVFGQVKTVVACAKDAVSRVKEENASERARLEEAYGVEGKSGFPPGVLTRLNRTHDRKERAAQRHAILFFLAQLHSYLRDLLLVVNQVDDTHLLNRDEIARLRDDASRLDVADVTAAVAALGRCEDALKGNGAAELHLERLFMVLALSVYGK